jgi:uncharacterized membrane protein
MSSGTHLQRWIFGLFAAMFALYCDKASLGNSRGHYQEALWNLVLVGEFLIELRPTLRRKRAALLALSLFCFHCLVMYLKRDAFPLDSSLILIFCALIECVILMFVYLRLCQSIDPQGPFGLTSAEKEARKNRAVRLG